MSQFIAFVHKRNFCGTLLVVRETRLVPEMCATFGTVDSDVGGGARRHSHTVATRLVADVCDITCTRIFTRFTRKRLRHRVRYIHDHVIALFDISKE